MANTLRATVFFLPLIFASLDLFYVFGAILLGPSVWIVVFEIILFSTQFIICCLTFEESLRETKYKDVCEDLECSFGTGLGVAIVGAIIILGMIFFAIAKGVSAYYFWVIGIYEASLILATVFLGMLRASVSRIFKSLATAHFVYKPSDKQQSFAQNFATMFSATSWETKKVYDAIMKQELQYVNFEAVKVTFVYPAGVTRWAITLRGLIKDNVYLHPDTKRFLHLTTKGIDYGNDSERNQVLDSFRAKILVGNTPSVKEAMLVYLSQVENPKFTETIDVNMGKECPDDPISKIHSPIQIQMTQ